MSVTQIFSEQTQAIIAEVETFFQKIVGDKMLWTRDILGWFGVCPSAIAVFLSYHQFEKMRIE